MGANVFSINLQIKTLQYVFQLTNVSVFIFHLIGEVKLITFWLSLALLKILNNYSLS